MGCLRAGWIAVLGLLACGRVEDGAPGPDEPPRASGGEGGEAAEPLGGKTSTGGRDASTSGSDASTGGSDASTGGGDASSGGSDGTGLVIADCDAEGSADPSVHDGHFEDPELGLNTVWQTFSDAADARAMGLAAGTLRPAEGGPFSCQQEKRDGELIWTFNALGYGLNLWGGGMILLLNPDAADGVDLSIYSAIRFTMSIAAATVPSLRVAMATEQTNSLEYDGTCDPALGACGNHFGYDIPIVVGSWREYTVWFEEMRQQDWPSQRFPAAAPENATGFVFQMGAGSFDYSIDDVELVP